MIKIVILFFVCIILLFLSAFFSGSETALFSLSEPEIEIIKRSDKRNRFYFNNLLKNPHNLLTTILLSNTVVNVAFSFLFTLIFLESFSYSHLNVKLGMLIDTVVITTILLIFGEFTPKFYALWRTVELSKKSITPLFYLVLFLSPFVFLLNLFNRFITAVVRNQRKEEITFSELKTLFEMSEQKGILKEKEKEIINSLFTLDESIVSDIMIPRTKVFSFSNDMKIADVYPLLKSKPYSRIPVYSSGEEKIEGILYLKDLLVHRKDKEKKIKSILRDALFVPENMRLKDLFIEFRKRRIHFAIVVNEFGGVKGIVTMNDILEEIVGSIKDEYQKVSTPLYRYITKDEILVDGELKIDDFPKHFYKQLPSGDYETVSGFLLSRMGKVPKEDETLIYKDLIFRVVKLEGRKLKKILIKKRQIKD